MSVKTVLVDGGAPVAASGGSAEFVCTLQIDDAPGERTAITRSILTCPDFSEVKVIYVHVYNRLPSFNPDAVLQHRVNLPEKQNDRFNP